MKISIIIPCYNVGPYIKKCVSNLLKHATHQWEIILINDGSEDNTMELLKSIKRQYSEKTNIVIINQTNKGVSETRNIGISRASGRYLAFVDGDDWTDDDYIPKLLSKINEGFDLVLTSYDRVFSTFNRPRVLGKHGFFTASQFKRRLLGLYKKELNDPSQLDSMSSVWSKLYRAKIIKEHQLNFISTKKIGNEDLIFNLQYVQHIKNIFIIDKPLYNYRKDNKASLTSSYNPLLYQQFQEKLKIIQETIPIITLEEQTAFKNRIALKLIGLGLNELSNPNGMLSIHKKIKRIIKQPAFRDSLSSLELKYMPIHWQFFFVVAREQYVFVLLMLLKMIKYMIYKK